MRPLLLLALAGCGPQPSVCAGDAAPATIDAMVAHLDTLPGPVDAACILASLERPLHVEATTNPFSAQPADGPLSPRLFVFLDTLSLSLVPSGMGSEVVEFGEKIDALHTLKGELHLPVEQPVDPLGPHHRILEGQGTVCRICHIEEDPVPVGDDVGYASIAIKPDEETVMDLDVLRDVADGCRPIGEPRCAVLAALFDGDVEHQPFPEAYPTIFDLAPE
ncbi:MAG: hypothetical protein H6737_04680 [Alphaproteobacteria bacterium]|nr:hypothetical protein [Alphaproteobacteria bacterium]